MHGSHAAKLDEQSKAFYRRGRRGRKVKVENITKTHQFMDEQGQAESP